MPSGTPPVHRSPPANDTAMVFALLVGVAVGGVCFLWLCYHAEIAPVVVMLQRWQMALFARVTDSYRGLDAQVGVMDPAVMTARELYQLCHFVGLFLRVPAALLVGLLAVLCVTRSPTARFTFALGTDRLIQMQARVFRPLAVVAHRRLSPVPLPDGAPRPLDPALHPAEWIGIYALDDAGAFDETGARSELEAQLGDVWRGPRRAAPLARCLFAAFALHASRQRECARALLGEIAESLGPADREGAEGPTAPLALPGRVVARADAVLRNRKLVQQCRDVAARHGFTATALMSVLWEARRKAGVLAPAEFLFTKLVDRRLWYALHSGGFPAETPAHDVPPANPRIEAAGSQAHWLAERRVGHPLLVPQVDGALVAVRIRHADAEKARASQEVKTQ